MRLRPSSFWRFPVDGTIGISNTFDADSVLQGEKKVKENGWCIMVHRFM